MHPGGLRLYWLLPLCALAESILLWPRGSRVVAVSLRGAPTVGPAVACQVGSLAAHDATIEKGTMFGLLVVLAGFEIVTGIPKCLQLMNDPDARAPGDYRFDPLGLGGSADLQEREISNGRLAMMAFSGILTQDVITGGKGFPYTFNGARDFIPPLAEANPIDAFGFCSTGIVNGCQ